MWFEAWQRKQDTRKYAIYFNEDSPLALGSQLVCLEAMLGTKLRQRVTNKMVVDEFRRRLEANELKGDLGDAAMDSGDEIGGESPAKSKQGGAVAACIAYISKMFLVAERFVTLGGQPLVDALRGKEITQDGERTWCRFGFLYSMCRSPKFLQLQAASPRSTL